MDSGVMQKPFGAFLVFGTQRKSLCTGIAIYLGKELADSKA